MEVLTKFVTYGTLLSIRLDRINKPVILSEGEL